ncbi:hypothetical protein SynPROSU1_02533 [Synechococcus sp. PROS-U-1]|nr:hypothetical protein SynPROSU1_02533 [Synechococcus sp. PROS-U-1]
MTLLKGSDLLLLATFQAVLTPPFGGDASMSSISPVGHRIGTKKTFFSLAFYFPLQLQ